MFNFYKIITQIAIILFACFHPLDSFADDISCPSADDVKNKKISEEFDWTVSEEVSLQSLLNVNKLNSVSIENQGEFIACTYNSEGIQLRLDGKPITVGCRLKPNSDQWSNSESGQYICLEIEIENCLVEIDC